MHTPEPQTIGNSLRTDRLREQRGFRKANYRGCQITPPRGFREGCWTRPPVYEIPFRENFCWTGQTAGGEVI